MKLLSTTSQSYNYNFELLNIVNYCYHQIEMESGQPLREERFRIILTKFLRLNTHRSKVADTAVISLEHHNRKFTVCVPELPIAIRPHAVEERFPGKFEIDIRK